MSDSKVNTLTYGDGDLSESKVNTLTLGDKKIDV